MVAKNVKRKTAPITGKQLRLLIKLGVKYRDAQRMNRQQASEEIEKRMGAAASCGPNPNTGQPRQAPSVIEAAASLAEYS